MEKFLEKIQTEIESKMLACVRGESIVKPFNQIYEEVREKPAKKVTNEKRVGKIYSEGEESIYNSVVQQFLAEHPELIPKEE